MVTQPECENDNNARSRDLQVKSVSTRVSGIELAEGPGKATFTPE